MSEQQTLELITETASGRLIKMPVVIRVVKNRIEFVKAPFGMKDEIKSMRGSKWHGFEEPPRKIWSVSDCGRNRFQLAYMAGENPYEWWERPLVEHEYERPLHEHQKLMSNFGLTNHFGILAAEMGCIAGDAVVHCHRAGRGFSITLAELCYKFHGGSTYNGPSRLKRPSKRVWDQSIDTYVRGFRGQAFGLTKIIDVVFQGHKEVKLLRTRSGKMLRLTSDHELCINAYRYGTFKPLDDLMAGDYIMVAAPEGWTKPTTTTEQTPPANLPKITQKGLGHFIDNDGYVRIGGMAGHPRANRSNQVYEHILVMEELLERRISLNEQIHHLNRQRWDNRPENLIVCTTAEHASFHTDKTSHLHGGLNAPAFCFCFEPIESIESAGTVEVYDIKCEGPYHNFVANGVVVHNCGKTLSAIEIMEQSGYSDWWWCGPKSGLRAVDREFTKWNLTGVDLELLTYEALTSRMKNWVPGTPPPHGIIFDESSRLKNHNSQRAQAAQAVADGIRAEYGRDGFVILMSGTPSPKSPVDWWSQAEIACPGFLREGDMRAFERRLGVFVEKETSQGKHLQRVTWLDDEEKCALCGGFQDEEQHQFEYADDFHQWQPSVNEVALLHERLEGLALVLHKKDCLDLPEKQYRVINCDISPTTERVAKALVKLAPNAITGLTWMRELSDGFQYREEIQGTEACPVCVGTDTPGQVWRWVDPEDTDRCFEMVDMLDPDYVDTLVKELRVCSTCDGTKEVPKKVRVTREVPTPKDEALVGLLEENEEVGRIVIFAGFTGTLDRVTKLCLKHHWAVIRVDGRGWKVWDQSGEPLVIENPLNYWADLADNTRVAFVAHPKSGGMSLTLTEAPMAVFYSNDFSPESRSQAEDRIHRMGTDENRGATIVDLIHLPTDEHVRSILRDNRRLELMTLGEVAASVGVELDE